MLSIKVEKRMTAIGRLRSVDCPKTRERELAYFCKHCKFAKEITGNDVIECLWEKKYEERR